MTQSVLYKMLQRFCKICLDTGINWGYSSYGLKNAQCPRKSQIWAWSSAFIILITTLLSGVQTLGKLFKYQDFEFTSKDRIKWDRIKWDLCPWPCGLWSLNFDHLVVKDEVQWKPSDIHQAAEMFWSVQHYGQTASPSLDSVSEKLKPRLWRFDHHWLT